MVYNDLHWVKGGLVWLLYQTAPLCRVELVESGGVARILRHSWLRVPDHEVALNVDDTAATIKCHLSC